jgi:hypothetical protein
VFLDALKERGPFHEVGQVEVEVVVFGEGVEVAEVELQEVRRPDAAHRRHGWLSGLQLCRGLVVLLSVHHSVRLHGGEKLKRGSRDLAVSSPLAISRANVGHQFIGHLFGMAIAHIYYHHNAISRVYDLRFYI